MTAGLAKILVHATNVFCEKGYAAASMRDLSRASGVSLSGLYYYFKSKEELLYLIQKDTFTTIVARLRERLDEVEDPAERIRVFHPQSSGIFSGQSESDESAFA